MRSFSAFLQECVGCVMEKHIYAVSELNLMVKTILDNVPELENVCVRG